MQHALSLPPLAYPLCLLPLLLPSILSVVWVHHPLAGRLSFLRAGKQQDAVAAFRRIGKQLQSLLGGIKAHTAVLSYLQAASRYRGCGSGPYPSCVLSAGGFSKLPSILIVAWVHNPPMLCLQEVLAQGRQEVA